MATDYTGEIGAILKRKHYDTRNTVRRERYAGDEAYREHVLRMKREAYAHRAELS